MKVVRLDHNNGNSSPELSAGSYVTGITVENGVHMVIFSKTDMKVYYARVTVDGGVSATLMLLYMDILGIKETTFVGGGSGFYPGVSDSMLQGYVVGKIGTTAFGPSNSGQLATGQNYAIILPTLRDESCVVPTPSSYPLVAIVAANSVLV